jgi:hypothetical protein
VDGNPVRETVWSSHQLDGGAREVTWFAEPSIIDRQLFAFPTTAPMDAIQTRRRFADLKFRVLVIGRANAGKTSILQRVCETTESPTIYRGKEEVCGPSFCLRVGSHRSHHRQVTLNPSMNVSSSGTYLRLFLNMNPARRALHRRRARVLQSQGLCLSRLARN